MNGRIIWEKDTVRAMVPKGFSVITEWDGEGGWTYRIIGKDGRFYKQSLSVGSGGWNWITEWPKDVNEYE